jgi:ABC-type branched-subunit amino acid transport system substrate-binding protein
VERTSTRGRGVALGAALLVLAIVAAACGSRLPEEVLADIDGERTGASPGSGAAPEVDGAVVVEPGEVAAGDAQEGPGGAAASVDAGGAPGDDGVTASTAPSGGAACKGGATDVGVTADEVKVASIVTASGPLPGATEGAFRGASAYFAKVNAAGGVCGRKITLVKGDDGLDPQRARGEFLRLEPGVLGFVGSYAVADSGYADLVASTGVPYLGTFIDPAGREAPNVFPRSRTGVAHTGPFVWFRQQHPDVDKAAFLFADVGGVRGNTPTSREAMKRAGYSIVYDSGAQATAPDFTAEVINMQRAGAEMVYLFAFELNMHVRLARNMRQQNYEPAVKLANIGYNSKLVELLGDLSNGWSNHLDHLPMLNEDEPARSPDLAEFLTWNERVFPGAQIDLFPVNAWGAAALFTEALAAVGPDVTRERLLEALAAITSDDGGGIRSPFNPSTGETQGCFVIAQVQGQKWVRQHPSEGYECDLGESFQFR